MKIIPVVDLLNGQAVHAREGKRHTYTPVCSPLCKSSDPGMLIEAYLSLFTFDTIYLADLNSIQGQGDNNNKVNELLHKFPEITFWHDAGYNSKKNPVQQARIRQIIGTETGITLSELNEAREINPRLILSLDFKHQCIVGNSDLLRQVKFWPNDVIVMSLNYVGSKNGPDFDTINHIKSIAGQKTIYVAGGIRNIDDINQLAVHGISGVLAATALHHGEITASEITNIINA